MLEYVTVVKFWTLVSVIYGIMFVRYFPQFVMNTVYSYSFYYYRHFQERHYMTILQLDILCYKYNNTNYS